MERISATLIFLPRAIILQLNRDLISKYGGVFYGRDNLNNSGSLDWVLDAMQYPIFGIDNYPTIAHKTAILNWTINEGHVFFDGNKRTSNMAAILFLFINGYEIKASFEDLVSVSIRIATCKTSEYSFEEYLHWIEGRIIKKY